jgi:hypothetical protein
MITELKYTGSTPGTDSNTYVLFATASPSAGVAGSVPVRNWGPEMGIHTFRYDIKHSQNGTVRGYRSQDGGATWIQTYDSGTLTAPTYTSTGLIPVEGFRDFKVEWVNAGTAQATWSVAMDVSVFP